MSDYMKEAERLADAYANTFFCEKSVTEILGARAALLAHIQRGAVPEGWKVRRDRGAIVVEHPKVGGYAATADSESIASTILYEFANAMLAAAPPPDQFRDAAKMMAAPACLTCSGHGMVGGLLPNGGGYESDPCPDCAAPAPAEVPMPECYVTSGGRDLFSEEQMSTYGAICRAAGYARGLAEAGRDAVPLVRNGEVLVAVTGLTGSGKSAIAGEIEIMCRALGLEVEWGEGAAEKHVTHADWTEALEMYRPRVRIVEANIPRTDAALRGEAK